MGKCCSVNEILVKGADGNVCIPSNDTSIVYFSPFFSDFNRTGVLVPGDEIKKFVAIVGSPCDEKYVYEETEDLQKFGWSNLSRERATLQIILTESRSLSNIKCVDLRTIDILIKRSKRWTGGRGNWPYSTIRLCFRVVTKCRFKYQLVVCIKFGKFNKEQSCEIYVVLRNRKLNISCYVEIVRLTYL